MSLYAADQSFPAALFAGWGYEDKTAIVGERYLYRVIPSGKNDERLIEPGSVYIGGVDYKGLPKPLGLTAVFGDKSVVVTWNYSLLEGTYNSYHIERSTNEKEFQRINKTPLLNITGGDRISYADSIDNHHSYFYRVIGITSFGEEGPISDTIHGKGVDNLAFIPHITRTIPRAEGVDVEWEFSEDASARIEKFELQRSNTEKGIFETVATDISPTTRVALYTKPLAENYLRIVAVPKEGAPTYSYPYLYQEPDNIPPSAPKGLKGLIDSAGIVRLSWDANVEEDLLGYRILRGQTEKDDLVPLNDLAVESNSFTDTISLKMLNAKVYYAIAAIDKRYNQSALCPSLILERPLLVKPAPPYITLCNVSDDGIRLEWVPGNDETIASYSVWRTEDKAEKMKFIKIINNAKQTNYTDKTALPDVNYAYQVISISRSNRKSDPSPMAFGKIKGKIQAGIIKQFVGQRKEKGILLKWEFMSKEVKSIALYRKEKGASFYLLKLPELYARQLLDDTANRNISYEYMIVLKDLQGRPIQTQINVD